MAGSAGSGTSGEFECVRWVKDEDEGTYRVETKEDGDERSH